MKKISRYFSSRPARRGRIGQKSVRPTSGLAISGLFFLALLFSNCLYKSDAPLLIKADAYQGALLINNVRLFSGKPGAKVQENINILVQGGKIAQIEKGKIEAPDAKVIDGRGKTIVPGMIDIHTHFSHPMSPPWLPSLPNIDRILSAYLYAGVTTVFDQGGDIDDVSEYAAKSRQGKILAPRVYFSGKAFTAEKGHPTALIRLFAPWPIAGMLIGGSFVEIDGDLDEITEQIQENKKAGASYTKVYLDEIPLTAPLLKAKYLKAVVAASKKAGLPVTAHVGRDAHLKMALNAGVDIFVHGPYRTVLNDDTVRLMKTKNAVMAPTVTVFDASVKLAKHQWKLSEIDFQILDAKQGAAYQNIPTDFDPPAEFTAWLNESYKHLNDKFVNIRKMKAAGVTLIVSTDTPNFGPIPGGSMHKELEYFIKEGGYSPSEALSAATYIPGRLVERIGGEKGLGYLIVGAPADLLLINGKPDQNIADLQKIELILVKGKNLVRSK